MIYDGVGNRTEVQDGTGLQDSTYDVLNRLATLTSSKGGSTVVHTEQAFNALNQPTSLERYSSRSPGALVASTIL